MLLSAHLSPRLFLHQLHPVLALVNPLRLQFLLVKALAVHPANPLVLLFHHQNLRVAHPLNHLAPQNLLVNLQVKAHQYRHLEALVPALVKVLQRASLRQSRPALARQSVLVYRLVHHHLLALLNHLALVQVLVFMMEF